jgi:hypothetical protein
MKWEIIMDRKKILSFIAGLLSKTVENGCTEEEAMAAATKANELLKKYDLSFSDLEDAKRHMSGDRYGLLPVVLTDDAYESIEGTLVAVAEFYDIRSWKSTKDGLPVVCLFGSETDVIFAKQTILMLLSTVDAEFAIFEMNHRKGSKKARPNKRYWEEKRTAFSLGFCYRMSERYRALKRDRTKAAKNSKELVVLKNDLVVVNLKKKGYSEDMGLNHTQREVEADSEAFEKGVESADRVNIETRGAKISEDKKLEERV